MNAKMILNFAIYVINLVMNGIIPAAEAYNRLRALKAESRNPTAEEWDDVIEKAGLPHERIQKS